MDRTLWFGDSEIEIHKVVVGPIDNNVFVVRCAQTGEAVLIDAANEHEQLLSLCQTLGVRRVVETHGHWDHIQAVPHLRDAGYSVAVSAPDSAMLDTYDEILDHQDRIEVGRLSIEVIHTPGHTPGSLSFKIVDKPFVFSGDTLFPGGPGATKFEGGDFATIIATIESQLFSKLDANTIVLPGHGDNTTIGAESPSLSSWIDRGW